MPGAPGWEVHPRRAGRGGASAEWAGPPRAPPRGRSLLPREVAGGPRPGRTCARARAADAAARFSEPARRAGAGGLERVFLFARVPAGGIQQQGLPSGAPTPASSIQPWAEPRRPRAADRLPLSALCTPARAPAWPCGGGAPLCPPCPRRRLSPPRPGLAVTLHWVG